MTNDGIRLVQPSKLSEVLKTALSSGIHDSILLSADGSLVAGASIPMTDTNSRQSSNDHDSMEHELASIGALVAGTWSMLAGSAKFTIKDNNAVDSDNQYLLLDCSNGKVCAAKVGELLLCLIGSNDVELGLLEAKSRAVVNYLSKELSFLM